MLLRRSRLLAAAVAVALVLAIPGVAASAPDRPLARNVILLIDDGAGANHHEVGSLYETGLRDGEAYHGFPFQVSVRTGGYGAVAAGEWVELTGYDPAMAWESFEYVLQAPTDSAAAATAMATGEKTRNRALGVDCAGAILPNVVEAFEAAGRSTGIVTSVEFSHATPAGFVAHQADRGMYVDIASQMINQSGTDVIMGAGHPYYNRFSAPIPSTAAPGFKYIGQPDYEALVAGTAGGDADGDGDADPWTLLQSKAAFQALQAGETPSRVFGLAQVRETLQQDRLVRGVVDPPAFTVAPNANVPSLSEMTAGALNVLDADRDGFFLMVEGGATDWAASANQVGLMIEEELAFNRAVDTVLAWVDAHSNWGETLVIVTSDHETGYLTGPGSGPTADSPVWTPIVDNGIGVAPGFEYNAGGHTNSLVPLYAKGDAGRLLREQVMGTDPVRGDYVDNTSIHALIMRALGAASG